MSLSRRQPLADMTSLSGTLRTVEPDGALLVIRCMAWFHELLGVIHDRLHGAPIGPLRRRQCFQMIKDFFRNGIPVDLSSQANGDVPQMARRRIAVTDFDVTDRWRMGLDAVQEI